MQARSHTDHDADLADLQQYLLRLAEAVDRAVVGATWALTQCDMDEARRVVASDTAIGGLRYELEEHAIQLLALKLRMPYEVRAISAVMFVAAELERIGDYAEGIATIVLHLANLPLRSAPPALGQMAHKAREMLQSSIRALIKRDTEAAARLEHTDVAIDQLYQRVRRDILPAMGDHPAEREWATYLLWIGHSLERIADRAVNIADRAAFATGAPAPRRQRATVLPL